jgi:hypothetical protein
MSTSFQRRANQTRRGVALAFVLLVAGWTRGSAVAEPFPGQPDDHFLEYLTRRTPGTPAFAPRVVSLADAFESGSFEIRSVKDLLVPVDKNGEGIVDPDTNLLRYKIRPARGSLGHLRRIGVEVHDQFGTHFFNTIRPEFLLVPAALDPAAPPPPPDPALHSVDHYKCYGIAQTAGPARFLSSEVEAIDRFQARRLRVLRPGHLCLPVDKNGEGIKNPAGVLTCYRVRRLLRHAMHASQPVHVSDQFGSLTRDVVVETRLCVPGVSPLLDPSPAPSPTPGATPSPTVSASPTPTPSPTPTATPSPTPTAKPSPDPTPDGFVDFSGTYRGTALDFDGQDDEPHGSPSDLTLTITQAGGELTISYSNPQFSCPGIFHATVAPGASAFSAEATGPGFCGHSTMTATLAGDLLSGRADWEDTADVAKRSWSTFEDFDRATP